MNSTEWDVLSDVTDKTYETDIVIIESGSNPSDGLPPNHSDGLPQITPMVMGDGFKR